MENRLMEWFGKEVPEVVAELGTDAENGLSQREAAQRLAKYGPNQLVERGGRKAWRILLDQFTSLMVLLLIGAALVSGVVLGEHEDAIVILVVVVLNAVLGFRQEHKAEQAIAALKRLAVPSVRVTRGGEIQEVPALDLVPGDLVHMEAGNLVPADCRLTVAANLRIQEAALTGEAEPVEKQEDKLEKSDLQMGDRTNMAHMGTVVTYGRGEGVVTGTGMSTELGSIATMIQEAEDEDSVLQKKLAQLSKMLVMVALGLIGVVALEAWLIQGMAVREIFMTAVSMAVAAIPEGLPAVVTISLALGAQRMLRRNALIRRLPAVETLGSVTVICSDKTGTLTQNRMTVTNVALPSNSIELSGTAEERGKQVSSGLASGGAFGTILAAGALCSDAVLEQAGSGKRDVIGDPTEGALVTAAGWADWTKAGLEEALPRIAELPFDSERKRMTTVHRLPDALPEGLAPLSPVVDWARAQGAAIAFTKGAIDGIIEQADRVWTDGEPRTLTDEWRAKITAENDKLAEDGTRVLALAMREAQASAKVAAEQETRLIYIGLVGMLDPLREAVPPAVEICRRAGIRPIMITGDHPLIAGNIARALGLESPGGSRTGAELATMDREALEREVNDVSIYARVSPEHKLKIVDALQKNGHVVAMTGDGVNDAPALKEADIGVAMGIAGTDVSKEAADMVLQDDNFATIVAAVEQGRIILDNIVRFVRFILASNWAEILVMLGAPLIGMPLPLFPVQILWMNLVTDGLPALALGVEKGERNVMDRPPRRPEAPIVDRAMALHIMMVGGLMAVVALVVGRALYVGDAATYVAGAGPHAYHGAGTTWQTMLFTVLVFAQLALAMAERSSRDSVFRIGLLSNRYMVGALALTSLLQLAVIYVPFMQRFFRTVPLSAKQLAVCVLAACAVLAAVEIKKMAGRVSRVACS